MKETAALRRRPPRLASAGCADHLPFFFTVSTIVVFGRAIATETGMNWPLPASRPLFPAMKTSIVREAEEAAAPKQPRVAPGVSGSRAALEAADTDYPIQTGAVKDVG
jgi:hypothetical protein